MGRKVIVPSPGSRRSINIWKPSQMQSFLPSLAERPLNRQGCRDCLPRWKREDIHGTAQQSVHCCCPFQMCLTGWLRRTRQWFNPPALQSHIFISPTGLNSASAMSCNFLLITGRGKASSKLASLTGQGIY